MAYDYSLLDGRITTVFGCRREFGKAMDWSERTTSLKMNGKVSWKQFEISKACGLLGICDSDIPSYFFAIKV